MVKRIQVYLAQDVDLGRLFVLTFELENIFLALGFLFVFRRLFFCLYSDWRFLGLLCRLLSAGNGFRLFVQAVQIYFPHWLELLAIVLQQCLCPVLSMLTLFLFLMFFRKYLGRIVLFRLVFLESFDQGIVLLVVELEVRVAFHFSKLFSLFKEFDCCLKSYIQFSYNFVESDTCTHYSQLSFFIQTLLLKY